MSAHQAIEAIVIAAGAVSAVSAAFLWSYHRHPDDRDDSWSTVEHKDPDEPEEDHDHHRS